MIAGVPASVSSQPLRSALVGAGVMGRWHARAVAAAGGELVAVVDRDPGRARELAADARVLTSLDGLASLDHRPDVVHVCTPVEAHAEHVRGALALGAHVLVEKPVAPDAAATRALLDDAAAAGRLLVPVHQFLFQPGALRLLAAGRDLGELVHCSFLAASAGADTGRLTPDELVAEILPHPLALFARLLPGGLAAAEWEARRPAPGELRAAATAGDTSLAVVLTSRGRPTRAELELVGTRASAAADLFHGFALVERGSPTRARKLARPFLRGSSTLLVAGANLAFRAARRESAYPGLRELVRRTYEAIAAGGPSPVPPAETLAVAEARDAILGAARGR